MTALTDLSKRLAEASGADVYRLSVTFKSNEHPFLGFYDPLPPVPKTDDEAIKWALGVMERDLDGCDCTLLKNGQPLLVAALIAQQQDPPL